jgi:hypothetical protein
MKELTRAELDLFQHIRGCYRGLAARMAERVAVFCRMFLADDPKAEFDKIMMGMSDLFDPPPLEQFETVEDYDNWYHGVSGKYYEQSHQDLITVLSYAANLYHPSNENQVN